MNIKIGWWLLPLLITVACFGSALSMKQRGDYDFGPAMAFIFAFIPTLAAWLVWALLN